MPSFPKIFFPLTDIILDLAVAAVIVIQKEHYSAFHYWAGQVWSLPSTEADGLSPAHYMRAGPQAGFALVHIPLPFAEMENVIPKCVHLDWWKTSGLLGAEYLHEGLPSIASLLIFS